MKLNATCALICALALACAPGMAAADPGVCQGEVVASSSQAVYASSSAQVTSVDALEGQVVEAGDALLTLEAEHVYAHSDGVVAAVDSYQGDTVDGTVLSVQPVSRYQIVCTVEDAYEQPENMLLHAGQTVYVKCTKDGSHRAKARIIKISGEQYTLETTGGELYVGETVYLYNSDEYKSRQRVGIGTVIDNSVAEYQASGTLTQVYVQPGDIVERGQLLYEYMPSGQEGQSASETLTSDVSGIVLSISAQAGQSLSAGEAVAQIAPLDALRVTVYLSEEDVSGVQAGDGVALTLPWQEYEEAMSGTVESVSRVPDGTDEQLASAASSSTTSDAYAGADMSGGMSTGMDASALSGAASTSAMTGSTSTYANGTTSAQAESADLGDGEVLYAVTIVPQQFSKLRVGMSVTVDFGAN